MTPRELVALAVGVILGAFLNARIEPCRRACCLAQDSDARRERWRRGEDPGPVTH